MLDPASQGFFDRERQRWFPPERNVLDAHATMFHHLPGGELPRVEADLARLCGMESPSPFTVDGIRFLGRGNAYTLRAEAASDLRGRLATLWQAGLTAQDRQAWRPHVTIQNKADPAEARALNTRLMQGFTPLAGTATGVALWHYLGGPWDLAATFPFGA